MKKYTLISSTVIAAIGFMSFGLMESNVIENEVPVDFIYDLGPRYMKTVTKSEMALARTFSEFDNLDARNPKHIVSFKSVVVLAIDDSYEPIQEVAGTTDEFNPVQLKLLRSLPYSADVLIRAEYVIKNNSSGELEDSKTTPHITIVPETQAVYDGGIPAFLEYLKMNSVDQTAHVIKGVLQPGKVRFTVSKKGTIASVKLISSSGYDEIDKLMVNLVSKCPGTWKSALDAKGQSVEQQFVYSFGIVGC